MEETLWKKWEFLKRYKETLTTKAVRQLPKKIKDFIVLTGGTSLHLFSAKLIFGDEAIRASEDVDFFNTNTKVVENPEGVEEEKIAEVYSKVLESSGFEYERNGSILIVKPHNIKVEFFYDSASYPKKTYLHDTLKIVQPKTLYRIKLNLLATREITSERDVIDIIYLSTKYGFPDKIFLREDIGRMLEWKVVENYLTEYGETFFRKNHSYKKLVENFLMRCVIHEED